MILLSQETKSLFVETGVENSPILKINLFRSLETETGFMRPFKCRPIVCGMGRLSSVSCLLESKHF